MFVTQTKRLREAVFAERRKQLAVLARDILVLLSDAGAGLGEEQRRAASTAVARFKERFGYCDHCAKDAASALLRWRFAELVG